MKLAEHIKQNHGTNAECARANKMTPQELGQMVKTGKYFVLDGHLYIKKRSFK